MNFYHKHLTFRKLNPSNLRLIALLFSPSISLHNEKTLRKLRSQAQSYMSSTNINHALTLEVNVFSFHYIYPRKKTYKTHHYLLFVFRLSSFSRPPYPSSMQQPAHIPPAGSSLPTSLQQAAGPSKPLQETPSV